MGDPNFDHTEKGKGAGTGKKKPPHPGHTPSTEHHQQSAPHPLAGLLGVGSGISSAAAQAMAMWAEYPSKQGHHHGPEKGASSAPAPNVQGPNPQESTPKDNPKLVQEKLSQFQKKLEKSFKDNGATARPMVHDLTNILRDKEFSEKDKSAFLAELIHKDPKMAKAVLSEVGTVGGPTSKEVDFSVGQNECDLVSRYLGNAYVADPKQELGYGQVNRKDLETLLDPKNRGMSERSSRKGADNAPWGLANLVQRSDNKELQKDSALSLLNHAKTFEGLGPGNAVSDMDRDLYRARLYESSAIAGSGSPEASAALLRAIGTKPGGMEDFVASARPGRDNELPRGPHVQTRNEDRSGLGEFIAMSGKLDTSKDPELQTLKEQLFDKSVQHVDHDPAMRVGLADYFKSNTDSLVQRLTTGDPNLLENTNTLTTFMKDVMWTSEKFPEQVKLRTHLAKYVRERVADLQGPVPKAQQEKNKQEVQAHRLGKLIGATEVGFQQEMHEKKNSEIKHKEMSQFIVDIVGDTAELIPLDLKIPGIGSIKDKGINFLKKKVVDWGNDPLPKAKDYSMPLYQTGLNINETYHDEMESGRGAVYHNYKLDYLDEKPE